MVKLAVILLIPVVLATENFLGISKLASGPTCGTTTGSWRFSQTYGASDAAYTGVSPNDRYFCWSVDLNAYVDQDTSGSVNSTFKVKLANPHAKSFNFHRSFEEIRASAQGTSNSDEIDDMMCMDPQLRAEVKTGIEKTTNYTAIAVAKSVQYQVARPNWVYTAVAYVNGGSSHDNDPNFCEVTHSPAPDPNAPIFLVRVAAIDMS